jgi:hypothetical protein
MPSVHEASSMSLLVLQDLAWMAAMGGSVVAVLIGMRLTQRRPD